MKILTVCLFILVFLIPIYLQLMYFYSLSWVDLSLCFDWKRPCRISVSISSSFQNVQKRRGIETRGGGESAESSPPPPPVPSRAGQPPPPGPGIGSSALGGAQGLQVKIWEILTILLNFMFYNLKSQKGRGNNTHIYIIYHSTTKM